jgi:mevalonate kinase
MMEHADAARGDFGPPAFGKVILLGEHAVVYGHKAIAGAIHLGLRCKTTLAQRSRLSVPAWDLDIAAGDVHPVARAFETLLRATSSPPVHATVDANLPAAAGLGSSAALCVAITRALQPGIKGVRLLEVANLGECCFHEQPSGIDVALSAEGGIGEYTKKAGLTPLACAGLPLVVGLSGVARSTATMVAGVQERRASEPAVALALEEIAHIAEAGRADLLAAALDLLGQKMTQNHHLLRQIGVSIEVLDRMVEVALAAGALGAKLTGAGGGGAMIALAPGCQEEVAQTLRALGHEAFVTTLGAHP